MGESHFITCMTVTRQSTLHEVNISATHHLAEICILEHIGKGGGVSTVRPGDPAVQEAGVLFFCAEHKGKQEPVN